MGSAQAGDRLIDINQPWAIPSLVAGVTGTVLGFVVFLQRPSALQNRAAAAFLYTNALGWLSVYGLATFHLPSPFERASFVAAYFVWCYAILAYLLLLSTLETPLTGWLRRRLVRVALAVMLVGTSIAFVTTDLLAWERGGLHTVVLFDAAWATILFFGVVAATSAWRRALPGLVRRKNRYYALAFIIHDAAVGLFLIVPWILFTHFPGVRLGSFIIAIPALAAMILQALVVYGILSMQLFDIDLKVRWGISKGLLAAVFFAGAFAVSELLAGFLSEQLGFVAGVLVTALILAAFAPVRRLFDRVAGRLVPAQDTPQYRALRKELVFRAQLEELMVDDVVSVKERRALLRLQETLGLDGDLAARLEREVLAGLAGRQNAAA